MNLKFFSFFLLKLFITLIYLKSLETKKYPKRFKKNPNFIETLLKSDKEKKDISFNYIYLTEINNLNIINNNNILIPITENIINVEKYSFTLDVLFKEIIFKDNLSINKSFYYNQSNKVNISLSINEQNCYNSYLYITNKNKLKIYCRYSVSIFDECIIKIYINNDIYYYKCFNNLTNLEIINFSDIKEYDNINNIIMKLHLSNFIYKYDNNRK